MKSKKWKYDYNILKYFIWRIKSCKSIFINEKRNDFNIDYINLISVLLKINKKKAILVAILKKDWKIISSLS